MGAPGKETIASHRIAARFGLDPVRDVQVLCPMNRGGLGARALNLELQQALNPPGEVRVERLLGFIVRIDSDAGEVVVDFEGREVAYDVGELDKLVPAYATTVHKAQGSEYPAVVIPLVTQHWSMLRRNPVDTAVTRGKRLVVVVGQLKALAIAIKGAQTRRRWSKLGEWLAPTA